jgi:tetratricopeptide (TPR) repeat protein
MHRDSLIHGLFAAFLLVGCSKQPGLTASSPEALRAYEDGLNAYQQFYYREAKTAFERALTIDSTFAMAWARLALVEGRTGNEPAAKANIEKALQYSRHTSEREQLYIRMWSQYIRYALKEAAQIGDSLIALYPAEKEAYFLRGNLEEINKRFDAATRFYQRAIEVDTAYALAVMSLGYVYSTQGEHEKALSEMEHYIRLAPNAPDPRASYADLLMRVGRYDDALTQYKKSLELKSDYWYAIQRIGEIYQIQGRLVEAQKKYLQALQLLPQNPQTESNHLATSAYLNSQRGLFEEAVRQSTEALRVDSMNTMAAYVRVRALGKLKKFNEADDVLRRIREELERRHLSASQAMLTFYLIKAARLTEENRLEEAQAECDSAADDASPLTRGAVYRQLAEIFLKQKAFDSAFDACEEALRVNPNEPEALLTLTRIYAAKGDKQMTREIGGRLLMLWQDADPDYRNLAEVRRLLGVRTPHT